MQEIFNNFEVTKQSSTSALYVYDWSTSNSLGLHAGNNENNDKLKLSANSHPISLSTDVSDSSSKSNKKDCDRTKIMSDQLKPINPQNLTNQQHRTYFIEDRNMFH